MIPNPWLILGVLASVFAVASGGYIKGRVDANANCAVKILALQTASQTAKDAEAAKAVKSATNLEKDNADADVKDQAREVVITKIVERPVYRAECFDPDGLSIANAALTGTGAASPKFNKPVP